MQLNKETIFEVKDGETVRKALMEAEVIEKKCRLYASMAQDGGIRNLFEGTATDMGRSIEKLKKMSTRYM